MRRTSILIVLLSLPQAGCVQAVHDCVEGRGCGPMFYTEPFICRLPGPPQRPLSDAEIRASFAAWQERGRENDRQAEEQKAEDATATTNP